MGSSRNRLAKSTARDILYFAGDRLGEAWRGLDHLKAGKLVD
jgi:hypothetical protein